MSDSIGLSGMRDGICSVDNCLNHRHDAVPVLIIVATIAAAATAASPGLIIIVIAIYSIGIITGLQRHN